MQYGIYNVQNGDELNLSQLTVPAGVDLEQETERCANGRPWRLVNDEDLPDDYFFNAWAWDEILDHDVTIDIVKARNFQRSVIKLSVPKMSSMLVEQLTIAMANEDTALVNELKAKLQKLNNILSDPRIDSCVDPELLKIMTLEYLMDN